MADGQESGPRVPSFDEQIVEQLRQLNERVQQWLDGQANLAAAVDDLGQSLDDLDGRVEAIEGTLVAWFSAWQAATTPQLPTATTGIGSVRPTGDESMAQGVRTVDEKDEVWFQFTDDHGDIAAVPTGDGTGIVVTATSDTTSVANFGSDASGNAVATVACTEGQDANGNPEYTAPLTYGVDGSWNLTFNAANQSGNALNVDDGSALFTQPAPTAESVAAGQATTGDGGVQPV